jgi:S-DNA-T family DNA segregation ATPase FtsK/SpoIIIE
MGTAPRANPFAEDRLDRTADYRPEWDVPTLNIEASDWLTQEINKVRVSPGLSVDRKIGALLGPPGLGKTHVFARVADNLAHDVLFVLVPQILERQLSSPVSHIRWHVVEALFDPPTGQPSHVAQAISKAAQRSFQAYFDQLPEQIRSGQKAFRQQLQDNPLAAIQIASQVHDLEPFQKFADSFVKAFPALPAAVVRAVALGWSPASLEARRWLRGDDLPEQDCKRLQLSVEPPDAEMVIQVVANVLQYLSMPLVICCDQIEAVLKDTKLGPVNLSNDLLNILATTPNTLLVLSCLEDRWKAGDGFLARAQRSFKDRVENPISLSMLSEDQALDLVQRRLRTWRGARPDKYPTWPIREDAIRAYVHRQPRSPRELVKVCKAAIDQALSSNGSEQGRLDGDTGGSTADQFIRFWNDRLTATRQAAKAAEDIQESELFQAVREALRIAAAAKQLPEGLALTGVMDQPVKQVPTDSRPSLLLRLSHGGREIRVIVAVSKRNSGTAFGSFFKSLVEAKTAKGALGIVLIRPRAELGVGPTAIARKEYDRAVSQQVLRPFPLESERLTFDHLQCLMQLLKDATGGLADLPSGKKLTPAECSTLLVETGLLKNLRLFESVFAGWDATASAPPPGADAGRPKGAKQAPKTEEAASETPKATAAAASGTTDTKESPTDERGEAKGAGTEKPDTGETVPPKTEVPPADAQDAWAQDLLKKIIAKLGKLSLPVRPLGVQVGPTFARLRVQPDDQTDIAKLKKKADSLMVLLGLPAAPLIGFQAGFVSIDVALPTRRAVPLLPLLPKRPAGLKHQPAFPVGLDVGGKDHWLNLAESSTCHLLIAGTTGSGKSELMKAILASLTHGLGPGELRIVLIDPKRVTFNFRGHSPYFDAPVAHDSDGAGPLLDKAVEEMERRYALLEQQHKSNVSELTGAEALPQIVIIFDEFADLMADKAGKKALEGQLKRLGAKARAAGIHIILGTQRTEASVVTPLLRSNLPGRISLKVTSDRDSNLILNDAGASDLLGKGDLLWLTGGDLLRLQCPYVSQDDLETLLRVK